MATNPLQQAALQNFRSYEEWLAQTQTQGGYGGRYNYGPNAPAPAPRPTASPGPTGTTQARLPTNTYSAYVPPQASPTGINSYPNSWWAGRTGGAEGRSPTGGVPQATLNEFSQDPEAQARLYTMQQGFGDRTRQVLNAWSDPVAIMHGLGMSQGIEGNIPARLDLTGQMYGQILGTTGTSQVGTPSSVGSMNYIDPRQIMNRVVNIRYSDPVAGQYAGEGNVPPGETNSFAAALAGPDVTPQQQTQNFISYVGSALQGLLPRDTFQAYLRLISNEAEKFMLWKMQNPQLSGTFNKWIGDRLGPTGGL